jgi:hypothetical protein
MKRQKQRKINRPTYCGITESDAVSHKLHKLNADRSSSGPVIVHEPATKEPEPETFRCMVPDETMFPQFHQGQIVICEPRERSQLRTGSPAFVRVKGRPGFVIRNVEHQQRESVTLWPACKLYPAEIIEATELYDFAAVVAAEKAPPGLRDDNGFVVAKVSNRSVINFNVGPYVYRLIIANRRMWDAAGEEMHACAIESRRLMMISPDVDRDQREEMALHEYVHAWEFHIPKPRNAEERCQLTAMIAKQFQNDLEAAGGIDSLRDMPISPAPEVGRPNPSPLSAKPDAGGRTMILHAWKLHSIGAPQMDALLIWIVFYTDPSDTPTTASMVAAIQVRPTFPAAAAIALAEQILKFPVMVGVDLRVIDLRHAREGLPSGANDRWQSEA